MASDNKTKFLRDAERYVLQGRIPQAIEEYLKIVKNDPDDVLTLNTIGDLCLREGRVGDAHKYFSQVAEQYVRDNFLLKAIAVYKKILNTDPGNLDINLTLASLYARQGLNVEARHQYLRVAELCSAEGKAAEALAAYEKVVEIDPMNSAVQLKLAETFLAEENKDKAHSYFAGAARALAKTGQHTAALDSFQRAMQLNPVDADVMKGFLSSALQLGNLGPALAQLKQSLELAPEDLCLREMLGQAFMAAGDLEAALKSFQDVLSADESRYQNLLELSKAFLKAGDPDQASECLDSIIPIMISNRQTARAIESYDLILHSYPEHVLALNGLAAIYSSTNDQLRYLEALDRLAAYHVNRQSVKEALECLEKILYVDPESEKHLRMHRQIFEEAYPGTPYSPPEAQDSSRLRTSMEAALNPGHTGDQNLNSAILEIDLLLNYGMVEKALGLLRNLEARDPLDESIRTRLLSIYMDQRQFEKAAEQCLLLAALKRKENSEEWAQKYLEEAEKLAPEMVDGLVLTHFAEQHGILIEAHSKRTDPAQSDPIEVDLFGDLSGLFFENSASANEDSETDQDGIQEEAAAGAEEYSDQALPRAAAGSLEEQLQEVDFYIRLGFGDEARAKLDDIAGNHPDNPELQKRYRQLEVGRRDAVSKTEDPGELDFALFEQATPDGCDVAAELDPNHGGAHPAAGDSSMEFCDGVGAVLQRDGTGETGPISGECPAREESAGNAMFADLMQEVNSLTDEAIAREEFETHFSLGTAYREMDLLEEAIREFQSAVKPLDAVRHSREVIQCCGMLSTCFLEKGMARSAIRWCQAGLSVPEIDTHEAMALRYDMGVAHSIIGDSDRALESFVYIFGIDPAYRDVARKIDDLRGGPCQHVP